MRTPLGAALAVVVCAAAQAATISTTLTLNGTAAATSVDYSTFLITGITTLTGGIGDGAFQCAFALATVTGGNAVAPYTITLKSGDTLTGKLTVPVTLLFANATAGSVGVTVTGGTGTYSGATGSFNLTGRISGDLAYGYTLTNFTGSGTIATEAPSGPPAITAVQDAASNTPEIAQGSIFIVKGSNLSAAGYTPFAAPRPTVSSDGVKVTFTPAAGGTRTDAYLVYLYNQDGVNQIACILPSTVAVGSYNVTVTNGTASAPFVSQVVLNKVELFTQDSTGKGQASVQNYISATVVDLNRQTTGASNGVTFSPAHPGQTLIAWGTGLGGYAAGDNTASPVFDFSKTLNIQAVVGGVSIPVLYAGRAGYAGEDQINFTLPANVPTGCAVSLEISVNGVVSAPTTISIAPDSGAGACV
jgi:uncharacterized protein (TIGR03437 family)